MDGEDFFLSDAESKHLLVYKVLDYKYNNGKVKENKCFTFSNIDEALTQMDRLTNYGELEDNSKVVVLKQGASENNERVLKTWFKGETTLNTRSIYG
jgi:hypothetical protein